MKITALEEYGLRCLVAIAKSGEHAQLSISEIAEMEGLSVPYTSKLLSILGKAKLVDAVRGRTGGFSLAKPSKDITLLEITLALGGPLMDVDHCERHTGLLDECVHLDNCSIYNVYSGLIGYITEYLQSTTLADMIDESLLGRFRRMTAE